MEKQPAFKFSDNSIYFIGTRMWRRGANLEGAVANFVESEQIVEFDCFRSSFLQVQIEK